MQRRSFFQALLAILVTLLSGIFAPRSEAAAVVPKKILRRHRRHRRRHKKKRNKKGKGKGKGKGKTKSKK